MNDWLFNRPKEMLDELRSRRPIFQIPAHDRLFAITFVTKYKDVLEVLERNDVFSVRLYEQKMKPPRGPFILGMADGPQYQKELQILQATLPVDERSKDIATTINEIVNGIFDRLPATGKLDVIQDIAWPVPLKLNVQYFGLLGKPESTLKRWLRDIYKDLFLNLRNNPDWTKEADIAVGEMNAYLTDLIISRPPGNTFVTRLIKSEAELGLDGIRRNVFGITVGVVETCLKAIARTIDQFLRRPDVLNDARSAALAGDRRTVLDYAYEMMRFNPQNHVLFRWCEADYDMKSQDSNAIKIPQNSLVFAGTLSAMFDPDVFPNPEQVDVMRPKDKYLFFGHGIHECLGRYIGPAVLQEILMRFLTLENVRRAPDDSFNSVHVLPEHFMVDYGPGTP